MDKVLTREGCVRKKKDYEVPAFEDVTERKLDNSELLPKGSLRMFVLAPTGQGKSTFICKNYLWMLHRMIGGIYIRYSLTANQEAYRQLEQYSQMHDVPLITFKHLTEEFIAQVTADDLPKFILVDDINENFTKPEQKLLAPLYFEARKCNVYVVSSGQDYQALPRSVKSNSEILCIYPLQTGTIHYLKGIFTGFIDAGVFEKYYRIIQDNKFWFIMLIRNFANYLVTSEKNGSRIDYEFWEIPKRVSDPIPTAVTRRTSTKVLSRTRGGQVEHPLPDYLTTYTRDYSNYVKYCR